MSEKEEKSVYELAEEIEEKTAFLVDKIFNKGWESKQLNTDLERLLSMIESTGNRIDMMCESLKDR